MNKNKGVAAPKLGNVTRLYFSVADPYETAKWYSEIFDLDPHASSHSPLRTDHGGTVVLHTSNGIELCFVKSDDKLTLSFTNRQGYHHAVLLFQVQDVEEIFERMKQRGVRIESDEINDRGECGSEFAFYDPDGKKIEISNWGTDPAEAAKDGEPKLGNLICQYLPAHDPYVTGKWYSEIFDLDPNTSSHSPLRENHTGLVVLHTHDSGSFFFMSTDEKLDLSFKDMDGNTRSVSVFQVNDIDEIYSRMKTRGVKIENEGMTNSDLGYREFAFLDPDARRIVISSRK